LQKCCTDLPAAWLDQDKIGVKSELVTSCYK
jgi:hypothetical protein